MGTTLPPKELELHQRVDEVLHYLWDPIGISDTPQARDEYHSYAPGIISLLSAGAEASVIAVHLDRLAQERMELGSNLPHARKVAEVLLAWKAAIDEKP